MRAKLVCYELKATPAQRTTLHKKLYGYKDFSNHGKYRYSRPGLITQIDARRITDGVFLVAEKQSGKLIALLKEFEAKTYIFSVSAKNRG